MMANWIFQNESETKIAKFFSGEAQSLPERDGGYANAIGRNRVHLLLCHTCHHLNYEFSSPEQTQA